MFVSRDDAVKIYARACRAWYGPRAHKVVREKIHHLRAVGDEDGVSVWQQLARELEADPDSERAVTGH